jgi:hypothetical protein
MCARTSAAWQGVETLLNKCRVENIADKRYIGSVIVAEANNRYYEPAPGVMAFIGIMPSFHFE